VGPGGWQLRDGWTVRRPHLPLALAGTDSAGGVAIGVAALITSGVGMRLLIAALDAWGKGSLLAAGLLHASFNAAASTIDSDQDWIRYAVTLSAGLIAAAALVAGQRGRTSHG
jgi:hypothetical protein